MATNTTTTLKLNIDIEQIPEYKLVMHNDDTTPIDLVVAILIKCCGKSIKEAYNIANNVHENGRAVIMTGVMELLETKKTKSMSFARQFGFNDFTMTVENK